MDTGPGKPQPDSRRLNKWIRSNALWLVAVFVLIGGTAIAAAALPKNSVGTKQLKKGAVGTKQLKKNAVNGSKVMDNSLSQRRHQPLHPRHCAQRIPCRER